MLHAYFHVTSQFNQRTVVQLINALTSIFKCYPLEVISELKREVHHQMGSSSPMIIDYCHSVILDNGSDNFNQVSNHKISSAILKFLNQVFEA